MANSLLMQAPSAWPWISPIIPGALMPSNRTYQLANDNTVLVEPEDAGILIGYGFAPVGFAPAIATTGLVGIVKPDGTSITITDDGTISSSGGGGGGITGSGTANSIPKFLTPTSVGDSNFADTQTGSPPVTAALTDSADDYETSPGLSISSANGFFGLALTPDVGSGGAGYVDLMAYGTGKNVTIDFANFGGTRGASSATASGQSLGRIRFNAAESSDDGDARAIVTLRAEAAEDIGPANWGGLFAIATAGIGTSSLSDRIVIDGTPAINLINAGVVVGMPSGGAGLAGTINATTIFQDGAPLASLFAPTFGHGAVTASVGAATLNQGSGIVTSEALVGAVAYTLTLTNSTILSTSTVMINATNSANLPVTLTSVTPSDGSVVIVVAMAALTGTVRIAFGVLN